MRDWPAQQPLSILSASSPPKSRRPQRLENDSEFDWDNYLYEPIPESGQSDLIVGISVKPVLKLIAIASAGALLARRGSFVTGDLPLTQDI